LLLGSSPSENNPLTFSHLPFIFHDKIEKETTTRLRTLRMPLILESMTSLQTVGPNRQQVFKEGIEHNDIKSLSKATRMSDINLPRV